MSSKRDELFKANHYRYKKLQRHFKFSFWAGIIPSGALFAILAVVYAIRGLAMLAGASLVVAQKLINEELGTNESTGLSFETPYAYLAYLLVIAAITAIAFFFKSRKAHLPLFLLYAAGAVFGLIGMFTGAAGTFFGMYLLAYGCYGMWLEDFVRRLYKELDYLSLQEGYPDFIEALNEPKAMANSLGLKYYQSEYQKRLRKETKENGENAEALPPPTEMDELSIDSPPPKGTRKIDNML
ncbi:MAG: hypothetical protein K2J11_00080 [Oscillospiraceae bacterium]|nr:hypothetical protein [Oscillospiraceae bacterium]